MKVSIIIPYKEPRGYLDEAFQSCVNQNGFILNKDYEIILSKGDRYLGGNVNEGVKQAKGKYIKLCPDDDLLHPDCLMHLYNFAEATGADLVCADAKDIGTSDTYIHSIIPARVCDLAQSNTIHGGTILYRKSTMPEWDESMWTAEEFDVSIRMAKAGLLFGYVPELVFYYRHHKKQKSFPWLKVNDEYREDYLLRYRARHSGDKTPIKNCYLLKNRLP